MKKKNTNAKTRTQYRDAKTGRFLTDEEAKIMKPSKVVKEEVPVPGRGDTDNKYKP